MAPLPIVICGKNPNIAKAVRKHLLPEYDAIHIILTPEAGVTDIPLILSGKQPPNSFSNIGSQNYTTTPVAVATGGGFNDEQFNLMKDACKDVEVLKDVPWLRPDMAKPRPGQAAVNVAPQEDEIDSFAEKTAARVKECLGGLDLSQGGVFLY